VPDIGALYLDTYIEPWAGGYSDPSLSPSLRSNYVLRESALALARPGGDPTAVLTHGANPGLVSHFVKRALLNLARDTGGDITVPDSRRGWAALAEGLGGHCQVNRCRNVFRIDRRGVQGSTSSVDARLPPPDPERL